MKSVIAAAASLALLAGPLVAIPVPVVWFQDDFESYATHTRLRLASPNWVGGTGPENYIEGPAFPTPGGDNEVRLKGHSGTGATSNAFTAYDWTPISTGQVQLLSFTLQQDPVYAVPGGNHLYVYMETTSAEIGRWYGHSGGVAPRLGGMVGPSVPLTDGLVHEFSISYDPSTGVTEWRSDGALIWSLTQATGLAVSKLEVVDIPNVQDWVWLDDVIVGTVPEPASLLLLGLAGLLGLRPKR